ncbi:MAG: hydrogenase nickel incorporation protein HypB [Isosphaeraceae bacterium]|nr:hydrogenase nickel incorporation protein HypB [Isosphaeraceae bacterium]
MCRNCGCDTTTAATLPPDTENREQPREIRRIDVARAILESNETIADANRRHFDDRGMKVVNLLSSPGSGKTELLVHTLSALRGKRRAGVVVGDLATDRDARRLAVSGMPTVQINTGSVCHLDASMIRRAIDVPEFDDLELLFVENVGNLVCPAAFDLGEALRVVLLSVTEGEDKPLKYPSAFSWASVIVITKVDLAEAAGFDRAAAMANLRAVNPSAPVVEVSARTRAGLDDWISLVLRGVGTDGRI